jgi:phosphomannomutase
VEVVSLTAPQLVKPEMLQLLSELRHKVAIGFVGGSNLVKQQEQLATPDINVTSLFDFCFAENGLTAFRMGEELPSQSFISWLGQEKYNKLVNWYVSIWTLVRLRAISRDQAWLTAPPV